MMTEGTELTGERNFDWKNRADSRAECCLNEHSCLESGLLTVETERVESGILSERIVMTGVQVVDWRNRAYRRAECLLEEQSGLESGMLTGGTERTGQLNVDWRNRVDW